MKNLKNKNQNFSIVIINFIITIILCLFFIVLSTAYFSIQKENSGTIKIAELDFCVLEEGESNSNLSPGDTINKKISIQNSRDVENENYQNLCPMLFRFSVFALVDDELDSHLLNHIYFASPSNQKFTKSEEYYYFNGVLDVSKRTTICNQIKFSRQISNEYQNKNIEIIFVIDAIQASKNAYMELWQDAPSAWKNLIDAKLI